MGQVVKRQGNVEGIQGGRVFGRRVTAQVVLVVRSTIVASPMRIPRAALIARAAVLADPENGRHDAGLPRIAAAGDVRGRTDEPEFGLLERRRIRGRGRGSSHIGLDGERRGQLAVHLRAELADFGETGGHLLRHLIGVPRGIARANLLQPRVAVVVGRKRVFGHATLLEILRAVEENGSRGEVVIDGRAGRKGQDGGPEKCRQPKREAAGVHGRRLG
jgi:hypothetical protein